MSINKRLERELANNPQTEQERIQDIETEIKLQRENLQQQHTKITTGVMDKSDDIRFRSDDIRLRDDAFFSILHYTQRLKSKVTILSDYQQILPMPNIRDRDVQITSVLQLRDPNKTAYALEFKTFLEDKTAHETKIQQLNESIDKTQDMIRDIVIPQILYLLLVWVPVLFQLYRYFYSENPLDKAIKQTQPLTEQLSELEKEVELEKERFNNRWKEKDTEYSALNRDVQKANEINQEYIHMEQLEQKQKNLEALIQSCDRKALQNAYQKLKEKPCYVNLFQLCICLCAYQHSLQQEQKEYDQCKQALITLGELYPKINEILVKFSADTMKHLSEADVFKILETHLEQNLLTSKSIEEKLEQYISEMEQVSSIVSSLNPKKDAKRLQIAQTRLQTLNNKIVKGKNKLSERSKFIELLKHFIQNKSGENLSSLYSFVSNSEVSAYQEYARSLKLLYPASLAHLEAEKQEMMLSVNPDTMHKLQERYLKKIIEIELSNAQDPVKKVASALKPLLGTNSWCWEHFWTLEKAIRNNPTYHENPYLAALVNEITSTVTNSKKLEPSREEKKPVKQDTERQEIVVNPNNPLPTFFQLPSRNESAVNSIIRALLGDINQYKIRCHHETLSNEAKQENIQSVGHQMLQYIGLLSDANAVQTISPDHLALLQRISNFIRQIDAEDSQNQLTASDLEDIEAMLKQLDSKHPIREGTEFLITIFQTKDEYIAINTEFAQIRLKKDLEECIDKQNLYEEKQKKRPNKQLSPERVRDMNKWRISSSCCSLLTDYVTKLNRFASPSNEEERQLLKPLSELATQIRHILRYEPKRYSEIPQMMQQFQQQCDRLGEHPACSVARRMEKALKETEDYTKIPLPPGGQLGGPKIK
jgi:hypothetical protein